MKNNIRSVTSRRSRLRLLKAGALAFALAVPAGAVAVPLPPSIPALAEAGNWEAVADGFNRLWAAGESVDETDLEYASFLSAAALFHTAAPDSRMALEKFAAGYPASPYFNQAVMMLGDCCFFEGAYAEALSWYNIIDPATASLSSAERGLFTYRLAVSRLMSGLADAKTDSLLRNLENYPEFRIPTRYYRAYYDYLNHNYDAAYKGFERVAQDLASSGADPEGMAPQYYMIQILYRNGRFDEVIRHGLTQLKKNPVPELLPELRRVIGLSYFKTGDHVSARGHLEGYINEATRRGFTPADDAVYALGVCEYEEGDRAQAGLRFSSLTDRKDMTGQGAWYHLGEIALAEKRYDEAVIDFRKAARMAYDGPTAERAAYNCIAAVTHGGRSPFQSTTEMYEEFLSEWPTSEYADEVRRGLYQAYAAQRDYDNALLILEKIKTPDSRVTAERQKLQYAKGTRLERAGRHKEAAEALREAVLIGADKEVTREANLWLGDALFGSGDYSGSVKAYDNAVSAGLQGEKKATALYQRAYSNMRRERYADAARDFSEVLRSGKASREITADARLRLADCQYYSGNLAGATETYREVRELDSSESDYATLRLALLAGLQGDRAAETSMLRDFLRNSPESPARAEAMSKLATSLEAQGKTNEAIIVLGDLLKQYPASAFAREGAQKAARLSMESGDRAEAIRKYREVIERWPSSEEAAASDLVLRDYYAGLGRLEEYADFLASVKGGPRIKASEMEEITFRSAERAYVANPADTGSLEAYIEKYPDGRYLAQALLWTATARFDAGNGREALALVDRILTERPNSPEAEDARLLKEDLAEYGDLFDALDLADSPRTRKKGLDALRKLISNADSPGGAQANVELAERLIKDNRTKEALEILEDFTSSGTPQQYWLARGFLALADLHHAEGKDWLAKEYVISLRDNYPGPEADITSGIAERLARYSGSSSKDKSGQSSTNRKSRKRK